MTFENKKNILIHMSLSIWVFACIFDIEIKLDDDIIGLAQAAWVSSKTVCGR